MFKGVYGYDQKSKTYWWYILSMGVEVESEKGVSRRRLETIKADKKLVTWYKETDFDI